MSTDRLHVRRHQPGFSKKDVEHAKKEVQKALDLFRTLDPIQYEIHIADKMHNVNSIDIERNLLIDLYLKIHNEHQFLEIKTPNPLAHDDEASQRLYHVFTTLFSYPFISQNGTNRYYLAPKIEKVSVTSNGQRVTFIYKNGTKEEFSQELNEEAFSSIFFEDGTLFAIGTHFSGTQQKGKNILKGQFSIDTHQLIEKQN